MSQHTIVWAMHLKGVAKPLDIDIKEIQKNSLQTGDRTETKGLNVLNGLSLCCKAKEEKSKKQKYQKAANATANK